MDIAAGNGGGSGVPGVAPKAMLAFTHLAASDIAWEGEAVVGSEFGDSVQLLEALRFLFDVAGERPCAINISLGTNGGPHDGSSLVEQGIDALVQQRPGRAVVIAASNSFNDGVHAAGMVPSGGTADLSWSVPAVVDAQSELEVWCSGGERFGAELIAPDGTSLGTVPLASNGRVRADDGTTVLFVSHRAADPNNGDNIIDIFLDKRVPGRGLDGPPPRRAGRQRRLPRMDRTQRRLAVVLRAAQRQQPHARLDLLRPIGHRGRLLRCPQGDQAAIVLQQRRADA